jgi:hypothetical protein
MKPQNSGEQDQGKKAQRQSRQAPRKSKRRSSDTTSKIMTIASHQKRKGDKRGRRMQEI